VGGAGRVVGGNVDGGNVDGERVDGGRVDGTEPAGLVGEGAEVAGGEACRAWLAQPVRAPVTAREQTDSQAVILARLLPTGLL
jgi:hypothetical protein